MKGITIMDVAVKRYNCTVATMLLNAVASPPVDSSYIKDQPDNSPEQYNSAMRKASETGIEDVAMSTRTIHQHHPDDYAYALYHSAFNNWPNFGRLLLKRNVICCFSFVLRIKMYTSIEPKCHTFKETNDLVVI